MVLLVWYRDKKDKDVKVRFGDAKILGNRTRNDMKILWKYQ